MTDIPPPNMPAGSCKGIVRTPMRPEWLTEKNAQRFWSHTKAAASGCIEWTARRDSNGYGQFGMTFSGGRHTLKAHRFAWFLRNGRDIPAVSLDHLCRNTSCVNPDHLEPVTQRENLLRGETFVAKHVAKTHCAQGHPYDEANTKRLSRGGRQCRECARSRDRRRYAAKKIGAVS